MSLNIVDFPIVLEGCNGANWISNSNETNPLVVICSHLGVVWFLGDQPDKWYC